MLHYIVCNFAISTLQNKAFCGGSGIHYIYGVLCAVYDHAEIRRF